MTVDTQVLKVYNDHGRLGGLCTAEVISKIGGWGEREELVVQLAYLRKHGLIYEETPRRFSIALKGLKYLGIETLAILDDLDEDLPLKSAADQSVHLRHRDTPEKSGYKVLGSTRIPKELLDARLIVPITPARPGQFRQNHLANKTVTRIIHEVT